MAKEINTSITIQASAETIWKVLMDIENYPKWNSFISSIKGEMEVGQKLSVEIMPPNSKSMTFKPKVLEKIPNKIFRWIGKLIIPGLFDGEHIFELIDHQNGTTTFIQRELFKGILIGMIDLDNTKRGFELMNQQLKTFVENNKQ